MYIYLISGKKNYFDQRNRAEASGIAERNEKNGDGPYLEGIQRNSPHIFGS